MENGENQNNREDRDLQDRRKIYEDDPYYQFESDADEDPYALPTPEVEESTVERVDVIVPPSKETKVKKKSPLKFIIIVLLVLIAILWFFIHNRGGSNLPNNRTSQSIDGEMETDAGTKETVNDSLPFTEAQEGQEPLAELTETDNRIPEPATEQITEAPQTEREESKISQIDAQEASWNDSQKIEIAAASATSTIVQESTTNEPMYAFDGQVDTNWQEGVDGSGIGQSLTATFQKDERVKYIFLRLGNWKTEDYFYGNNRPRTMTIELGSMSMQVEFANEWKTFCLEVSPPCAASSLRITIDDVYQGITWDDTVITDVILCRE